MIAITRSAWITPSSTSLVSSEASETEWMGTLRTSMADGVDMAESFQVAPSREDQASVRHDDRACRADVGHGVDDPVEARDHAGEVRALHETADGVDLGAHRPTAEMPLRDVLLHLGERHPADRLGLRRPEAERRLRYVGRHHQNIGVHEDPEQSGAQVLVDHRLDAREAPVLPAYDGNPPAAVGDDHEPGLDQLQYG